jgi:hypothetical protein
LILANVLNDITNYEAHQNSVPVQNLSQNVTNAPTCNLNNFQIPAFQGLPGIIPNMFKRLITMIIILIIFAMARKEQE